MKIERVDHIQIAVPPDMEGAAIEFYGNVLGLRRVDKPEGAGDARGAWFDAGNVQVHLGVQDEGFVPAKKAHSGFVVRDLEEARQRLKDEGLPIHDGGELRGMRRFFSEDPAGNRLEFLARQPSDA